tara:strand:+ start:7685 stop:9181 length:1497 start_codon:yes stop_codon:yes gene_type:complete
VSLRLKNTLTNRTETFIPIRPNQASIYCCGVTVYDLCHLGHARSYIVWDVLRRLLVWKGFQVTFVQNFTDIDDKILKRASEQKCSMEEISEKNIKAFNEDMESLGILTPDRMPKATKSLNEIRSLIKELEEKGAAYSIEGDVYFAVKKHQSYGKLSHRNLDDQKDNAGGRLNDKDLKKENSFDFALWKKAKEGEPSFPSPWGEGRPGWHIECSAMIRKELGKSIDIHLGGADLIFPHHENEIAQSETANETKLANYWLHNGMVNVNGQKMSKSLGNFTTIRALLNSGISAMSLRLFVLQIHYRKPLDFTNEALIAASKGWEGINTALLLGLNEYSLLNWPNPNNLKQWPHKEQSLSIDNQLLKMYEKFITSMESDLNTSAALSVIFELSKPLKVLANKLKRESKEDIHKNKLINLYSRWHLLFKLCGILGLRPEFENKSNSISNQSTDISEIETAIKERLEAKQNKNYSKSDKIRSQLKLRGIELIDKSDGSTEWTRV